MARVRNALGVAAAVVVLGNAAVLAAAAAAGEEGMLRGARDGGRELSFQEFTSDLDLLPKLGLFAGMAVGGLLVLIGAFCVCVKCCRRKEQYDPSLYANPYANEWNPHAGGSTLVRKGDLRPSPALASFMAANPVEAPEEEEEYSGVGTASKAQVAATQRSVSMRMTGEDYGRLDQEAKDRIRSIRLEGNLQPIQAAKPSSKALKMLGVEEDAIARPFDEDVQTRMQRMAQKAGGGMYSPGLATAKLGNQIAAGFKERRAKQLEKARRRKEKEAERAAQRKSIKDDKAAAKPPQAREAQGQAWSRQACGLSLFFGTRQRG